MLRGLDASACQDLLPYASLEADMRFVILKAQQGNDGFDPFFIRNVQGAIRRGLEPFAYCFAYPLPHLDPKAQAQLFVQRVGLAWPELAKRPLFLDYEWPMPTQWKRWGCTAKQISEWCAANAEEVERYSGRTPVIYTYPDWWANVSKADVSWASLYPLWLASYRSGWPKDGDGPKLPKPWAGWLFWQFDGNGGLRLPNGVDADFCVFNGDEAALQTFIKGPGGPVDVVEGSAAETVATRP
jgi:GH25 family lysozyme M1 (1,4-beta-N-acetylmuramidase)